jgi:hypothetical protein
MVAICAGNPHALHRATQLFFNPAKQNGHNVTAMGLIGLIMQ